MAKPFNTTERNAIETGRLQNPNESQRGLASRITRLARSGSFVFGSLKDRSVASIYSAIRRRDAGSKTAIQLGDSLRPAYRG